METYSARPADIQRKWLVVRGGMKTADVFRHLVDNKYRPDTGTYARRIFECDNGSRDIPDWPKIAIKLHVQSISDPNKVPKPDRWRLDCETPGGEPHFFLGRQT